ncbi:AMP-binding protein [Phycicoccus sp. CSK15P-2]|uniref:class I adenylate-forming enzyme family protein n=1 Tax=Phycicoccus sp. CSK15P-2 TaxID=2807627 RepID=UPI0027DE7E8C|nr:AMP-binding protein [Phycicoccus sp. CSK15P-2]
MSDPPAIRPGEATDGVWPQPLLDRLEAGGDRPVFEDGDVVTTAAELSAMVRRTARGLRLRGIGPGDGVALAVGVDAPGLAAVLASFAVGARVSGLRPELTTAQVEFVCERDEAVLVDDAVVAELAATPDDGVPLRASGRVADVARIVNTSGSTGNPKGCCQTYGAMSRSWGPYPDRWPPAVRELASRLRRYLVFGSLSSQVMLEYAVLTLTAGGTLVAAHPPGFPGAVVRHRATASVITVGKLHQLVLAQRADPADLSGLEALLVSGSPLEPGRLAQALDVLGPVVFHGYGQTETGMIAMATPEEMLASPGTMATVGRPPAEVDVSVRDGELYVRTPSQACCYRGDEDETAAVFVDGWVRTRDLAEVDDDGYLRLLGRVRDVVIVDANLVYAGPVERVLAAAPGVAEAYVVGRPDDRTGEAVHAFVVPLPGCRPDLEGLRRAVTDRLGRGATPATVTVIDRVPVSASGKPDKSALRSPQVVDSLRLVPPGPRERQIPGTIR